MTLVGLTALSVEIITNASTPQRMASSTRVRVPKTLFLTASPGLASIIGTCLCAAAWKTTSGRCRAKTVRRRAASVMLATQGTISVCPGRSPQLALEEEQAVLGVVEQDQPPGRNARTWRQISEPMLPAAPVTRTTRPWRKPADRLAVELDRLAAEQVMDVDVAGPDVDVAVQEVRRARG